MTSAQPRSLDGLTIPAPGVFDLDAAHTAVSVIARHLVISKVRGSLALNSGVISIAEEPLASTVEVRLSAASINTGQADRDNHLRSPDFLDATTFPELIFTSTRVAHKSGGEFSVVGNLTIRDITREVQAAVEFEGIGKSMDGRELVAFSAEFEVDREEFGMTWNMALEAGGVAVGKKLKVEIAAEAVRRAE